MKAIYSKADIQIQIIGSHEDSMHGTELQYVLHLLIFPVEEQIGRQ